VRFVPYGQLAGTPNVIVDGSATDSTVLTLSHWPNSGAPAWVAADLSAQMVFRYLDQPERHVAAEVVSTNHFDQDGLVGVFALVDPPAALARRERLVDIAAAGDFGTYRDRDAARAAIAIASYADPHLSPVRGLGALPHPEQTAVLHRELLPLVAALADDVEAFRPLWEDEDAILEAGERAFDAGAVTIEELPALDLAVVTLPEHSCGAPLHRFTEPFEAVVHPFAVHRRTERLRLLYRQGRRYELQYRYETWVQLVSRHPAPRIDLGPLADELSALERHGAWHFDGVGALTPALRLHGSDESAIDWEDFLALVTRALSTGVGAWDPYRSPATA
jgi:hypothetical protein